MTISLRDSTNQFTMADFEPLQLHYDEQVLQIHIMATYAQQGLNSIQGSLQLAEDYFTMERSAFLETWLPGHAAEIRRQTTPASWQKIVDDLNNPQQKQIVTDDRKQTNVLVLAGPGSGKTRVMVHRIAYLVRVMRQNPRAILALAYNRHAATEIRRRLFELIGDDARGVTISTCHGFAMRVIGASFAGQFDISEDKFDEILKQAVVLLRGDGLPHDEAEAQRDQLIEGYRWILVDEYQDIGPDEYELIAGVAGRSIEDEDRRLSLFAVGDDDQNIYTFKGASVEYIKRFEQDYKAKYEHLTENYRSTDNIIRAANCVIAPAAERMKADHDITVNHSRKDESAGGLMEQVDPVGRGRVQVLKNAGDELTQAVLAMEELERLSKLPDWDWTKVAVIAREWDYLQPVRSYCEEHDIPVQFAQEERPPILRLRETQALFRWLSKREHPTLKTSELADWIKAQPTGPWWDLLEEGIADFVQEFGDRKVDRDSAQDWLVEWGRDARKRQTGLLLVTAHSAKGLEFDDVVVLDGGWERRSEKEDQDAARRLYYVAMTRARRNLVLMSMKDRHPILNNLNDPAFLIRPPHGRKPDVSACKRIYKTLALGDIDVGFAGRLADDNPSLAALDSLQPGDSLQLRLNQDKNKWELINNEDVVVCRLAKNYSPPENMQFLEGSVHAITLGRKNNPAKTANLTNLREKDAPPYNDWLKRDEWHQLLPELVFVPKQ